MLVRALVASFVLCASVYAQTAAPRVVELDRIVAIVNDDVIVASELNNRMHTVREQLRQSGVAEPPTAVLEKQVLERLIVDRLQVQIAEQAGIRVDDESLNRAVAEIAAQNHLTLRQFRDILERDGFDFAKFREEVRAELIKTRVRQAQVDSRVNVSPEDVDNYLATLEKQGATDAEYHLVHILIATPDGASPEQIADSRARAERVLAALRGGADFGETAVAESDGQQALEGGDLGWRRAEELPTIFADVVPTLPEGEPSDLIRSPSGFHIVEVVGVRGGGAKHVITQTRARHILIRPNDLVTDRDAEIRLEQFKIRIEGGDDFAEIARASSDDTGSAVKGGDIGWINPGDTVPEFERQMNALAVNQVSDPFRTQFGWHLLQVTDRREHDGTDEVRRSKAAEQLRTIRIEEEYQAWLRQIRDEAYVEYRLDEQ